MISADDSPPCDRPNLSKDYLSGSASEDWIPLRPAEYYVEKNIELVLSSRVAALDTKARQVQLENGKTYEFGALLIATGANPVRLNIDGATASQVHYLRSFNDSRAIVAKAATAKRVVVVGASFIGLEVAASLREQKIASSAESVGGFRFWQSSQGVIEGHLHRFEGAKSEGSSGNHTNFVVEALDSAA